MYRTLISIVLLSISTVLAIPHLTQSDEKSLKNQFAESLVFAIAQDDLAAAYHSLAGVHLMGEKVDEKLEQVRVFFVDFTSKNLKV